MLKMMKRAWLSGVLAIMFVFGTQATAQTALDLRNADLKRFVEIVSETTGRSFILDPLVLSLIHI